MKTKQIGLANYLAFSLQLTAFSLFSAAPFDCGSTGAYGAMNITNSTTLDMPPDGIFHCTTITVASGATLKFNRNSLNTPVYLLATGDVTINGTIDVSGENAVGAIRGKGGPGGFDGGNGGSGSQESIGSDGQGPGGGKNLPGWKSPSFASMGADDEGSFNTNMYGNAILWPLIGGSGAAGFGSNPGYGGGGGGGAILIASNNRIAFGGGSSINSLPGSGGATGNKYSGSGGAIRLASPIVFGTGTLNANRVYAVDGMGTRISGYGRVRIDCIDSDSWRNLAVYGIASRGSRMAVFPPVITRLDIVEAAGSSIANGTNSAVQIELPAGASTNQVVTVQARNFTNDVPIRVVVTPDNGPRVEYDATILMSSGNPPFAIVPVVIPVGTICNIHAWTR